MNALPLVLQRLEERVRSAVSQLALFPAIRQLEAALSESAPIGTARDADDERIRFSHPPTFALPAGEILSLAYAERRGAVDVTVKTSLLGLLGSESPLSPALSEEVLLQDEDDVLQELYDMLHHRALSLLYRGWRRFQPNASSQTTGAEAYSRGLLSMVGQDGFSPYEVLGSPSVDPLFALGLSDFARCDPSFLDTLGLEQLLRRRFPTLNARVVMSEPRLVEATEEELTSLGAYRSTLGDDAAYGGSALDPAGVVRVQLGPVERETYEALLPGGSKYREIQPLMEMWLAGRAAAELEIAVAVTDAPALCLGEEFGGQLGVDAQYHASDARRVRARVMLVADPGETTRDYVAEAHDETPDDPCSETNREPPDSLVDARWSVALTLVRATPPPRILTEVLAVAAAVARGNVDAALDLLIRRLDDVIAEQIDAVLHHPDFQALEARWRGLEYLTNCVRPDENIQLAILSLTKSELATDLMDSTELTRSRTYELVYTSELGTFGGQPYGAILADMEFDAGTRDVELLQRLSALASVAHAPFVAGASPKLLQLDFWRELPAMGSVRDVFDQPSRIQWNALRERESSRAVGLLVGRPLHRAPYADAAVRSFAYVEAIGADGSGLLFGSPIYAFGTRLASSFGRHRTLAAIVGDVDASPAPTTLAFRSLGRRHHRPPLEITITPRIEHELRDLGLIPLVHRTDSSHVFLRSANSLQSPKEFGSGEGGRDATISHLLGTKFPYFTIACRFAQYVKVLEREMTGASRSATEIAQALNAWLSRYVIVNATTSAMRARFPLRSAEVTVSEIAGEPGWHRGEIRIRPHLRYLDRHFTLSVSNLIPPAVGAVLPGAASGNPRPLDEQGTS